MNGKVQLIFKSASGVSDQLLTSGTHFIVNIILAREMDLIAYGKFAAMYSIFILAFMIHSSLCTEPVSVINFGRRGFKESHYYYVVVWGILISLPLILFSVVISFFFPNVLDTSYLPSFLFLLVASMIFWSFKTVCYRSELPEWNVISLVVYSILNIGLVYAIYSWYNIKVSPFWLMGFASLVSSIVLIIRLPKSFFFSKRKMIVVFSRILSYSKWSLPAGLVIWFINNSYFLLLPYFLSFQETASFKAIVNLLLPVNQVIVGASLFLLPHLSKLYKSKSTPEYNTLARRLLYIAIISLVIFSTVIAFTSNEILLFVYGNKYTNLNSMLVIAGIFLPFLWGSSAMIRTFLRSIKKPKCVFYSYVFALIPIGLLIIIYGCMNGVFSALTSIIIVQLLILISLIYFSKREKLLFG